MPPTSLTPRVERPYLLALGSVFERRNPGLLLEVFAGERRFRPGLAAFAFSLFAVGQALRLTAIRTLGWRWSTRIMTVPGVAGTFPTEAAYMLIFVTAAALSLASVAMSIFVAARKAAPAITTPDPQEAGKSSA